ncbi:uncharacterized protein LOC132638182 isoform X2 [Lycium barbarum]|uniref:uncharacterized protein LOC132638182 isoform X2 n=1 Tax=Lycium barbarum TaxID=112863 RepID=UPI00293E4C64|nr:uncharacterized protein LOC132638182 isoform X2 [Lycium barbarum]
MAAKRAVLQCGDCETLLKSVEEAQQHVNNTCHTNFRESNEAILNLVCTLCRKTCTCKTESDYHTKRTGHTEFQDRTAEVEGEEARRSRRRIQEYMQLKLEEIIKSSLPDGPATKAEQMSECLWTIKQNHMDAEAKVKTAFNTLLTFAKNVATNPDEEKYRKIRLSNALFQDRVGKLQGGIEFLELCGFERMEGGEFLYLQREKVDMDVLYSARNELNNAIMYDSYIR